MGLSKNKTSLIMSVSIEWLDRMGLFRHRHISVGASIDVIHITICDIDIIYIDNTMTGRFVDLVDLEGIILFS